MRLVLKSRQRGTKLLRQNSIPGSIILFVLYSLDQLMFLINLFEVM